MKCNCFEKVLIYMAPWMTDRLVSREADVELDLESGGTTTDDDRINHVVSESGQTRRFFSRVWDEQVCSNGWVNAGSVAESAQLLFIDKNSEGEYQRQHQHQHLQVVVVEEKRKKKNSRKPPKPPRPPKGSPMDAADQKLMQEVAELALRKRARIERNKALKMVKTGKASSWSSSLSAMVITVLFCLVIIFQGICPRSHGNVLLHGSPEPAVAAASKDLISVQIYKNYSPYEGDGPRSGFTGFILLRSSLDSILIILFHLDCTALLSVSLSVSSQLSIFPCSSFVNAVSQKDKVAAQD